MKNIIDYDLNYIELFKKFIEKEIWCYYGTFTYTDEQMDKIIDCFNKNNEYISVEKYYDMMQIYIERSTTIYRSTSLCFKIKFKNKKYEWPFYKHVMKKEKILNKEVLYFYKNKEI